VTDLEDHMTNQTQPTAFSPTPPPPPNGTAVALPPPPTQPSKDQKKVQAFLKKTGLTPDQAAGLAGPRPVPRQSRAERRRNIDWSAGQGKALAFAPPRPLATLEARDVTAWFGDHKVLDRVSLTMPAGVVTSLIGPSGCGKSTFLRTLNRMHEQVRSARFAGSVMLDGRDIYDAGTKVTQARTHIGMVFQRPNPFPAMSIYDNVVSGLKLEGIRVGRDDKDDLVEKNLVRAGLWKEVKDRLSEPGGSLSGGQQQRLCIARALAVDPRVLLMDEPCSALDPTSTRVIEETMTELQKEVTIVIVTHNMQQAQRVSQQCAFFLASQGTPGGIVEYGDTAAMFGAPQDQRTRDYVNGRFG
jgi:phosphate transport system ATP-binding protein